MGSQQSSQTMPENPLVPSLIKSFLLSPIPINQKSQKQAPSNSSSLNSATITYSLAHRHFANEFSRIQKSFFDRSMNPFCPVLFKDRTKDHWGTACFINPLVALFFNPQKIKARAVLPVYKRAEITVDVEQTLWVNEEKTIGMAVVEVPFWKAGWAGVSQVKNIEELQAADLKSVNHPSMSKQTQQIKSTYIQQVTRLKMPKMPSKSKQASSFNSPNSTSNIPPPQIPTATDKLTQKINNKQGSLICRIIDKKPYIVGFQISDTQARFIDEKLFMVLQQKCKEAVKMMGGEREVLKAMDLHQFQIQTQL